MQPLRRAAQISCIAVAISDGSKAIGIAPRPESHFFLVNLLEIASNDNACVRLVMMICPVKTNKSSSNCPEVPALSCPGDRQILLFYRDAQLFLFPNGWIPPLKLPIPLCVIFWNPGFLNNRLKPTFQDRFNPFGLSFDLLKFSWWCRLQRIKSNWKNS